MRKIVQMAALLACTCLLAACGGKKENAPQSAKPPVAVETAICHPDGACRGGGGNRQS